MKKRILSLLLLVAMILTMVPVMVSAEEAATESEQIQQATNNEATADTTPGDLHDWYIKDGLTALYSTFGADNGVDLTAGTWTSKVGAGVATLGTKARWSAGEFGGIGYTVLYGTVAEDGSYVKESSYNNQRVHAVMLDLGKQLPTGDYTVEYFAMYKPYYVADAEGNILVKDGAKVQSYDAFEGVLPGGCTDTGPIERFGVYAHYTYTIDGQDKAVYNTTDMRRGYSFFCFDNPTWYAGGNGRRWRIDNATRGVYHLNDVLDTYSITLDEMLTVGTKTVMVDTDVPAVDAEGQPVLDADGNPTYVQEEQTVPDRKINVKFSLFRGATAYHALSPSTTKKGESSYYDPMVKTDNTLYLAAARPADFFGVRVYDRALTISELRQNRAVDILLYYGIALDASVVANAAAQKAVCGAIYDFEIVTDATAKAAKKAELETLVAKALENAKIIGLYAAPESMTSFFTIYVPDSINLTTGKWADLIGGDAASFGKAPTETEPSRWFKNADGSVGSNTFVGYVKADGTKAMNTTVNNDKDSIAALGISIANHAYWKNNGLIFGTTKLPTEDFTVEYMAMYRPYLVADADKSTATEVVYARDAEGNLIEAYSLFGTTPATTDYGSPGGRPVDSIGDFTTLTQRVDSTSGWGSSIRGTQHWMYGLHYWGTTSQRNWLGTAGGWGKTSGLANAADTFKHNNVIKVYGVSLDETDHADDNTSILFTLYRDANKYASADGISWDGSNTNKYYTSELSSAAEFYLSGNQPTDFYGVRIYNKALSNAEKAQNVAADLILYYGIELDAKTLANAELMEVIYTALSTFTFEKDEAAKAAKKVEIEAAVADAENRLAAITLDGTLYVTEGLSSLFTAFAGTTQYMVEENGSNKIWLDRAGTGNATFQGSIWTLGANGGVGKIYWRGTSTGGVISVGSEAWNTPWGKTPLSLGLELLPNDDYTVEYLAYFPPIYAKDAATGEAVAHYTAGYTESYHVVDMYGFLEFCTVYPGGKFDGLNNYLRGRIGDAGLKSWGGTSGGGTYGFGSVNFKINKRDTLKVDTHGLYRDETSIYDEETGELTEVKASYVTLYNTVESHKYTNFTTAYVSGGVQGVYVSSTEMKDGKYYFGDDTGRDFFLSSTAGATFYALRVYDRVLTKEEREQNRMADVLYYYGIELTAEQKANEDLMAYLTATAVATALEQDASAYAAEKAAFKKAIDDFSKFQAYEYIIDNMYAAQDNLVANYTTFVPGQYDLSAGTWTDRVDGKTATLVTKARWSAGEFGGIGFNTFCGAFNAAGEYENSVGSNNFSTSVRLEFGIAQLPADDFTVEYVAMYKPLYVYDANQVDNIARDAAGNKIETFSQNVDTTGLFADKGSIDNLGWFQSLTGALDGQTYKDWRAGYSAEQTRGALHWAFGQQNGESSGWYTGAQRYWLGNNAIITGGLNKVGDAYQTNNQVRAYAITLKENTTGEGDSAVTEAIFSLYRDGALYNSNEAVNAINSSANGYADGGYYVAGTEYDAKCRFWLSNKRPTDFFAVRIYDKVLTEAEKNHNHLLDLIMFYELDVPMDILEDASLSAELAALLSGLSFATDAIEGAANLLMIADAIEAIQTTSALYTLYVQEGLVGNFTALSAKDMMASVEGGTWANRVAGGAAATMGNKQYWHKNSNGSVGFNIFYGGVDANGTYNTDSSYNNYAIHGTRLEFGIGLLPKNDFTVEMVAQINPVYAADAYGNPAGETFLLNGTTPGNQQYGDHATTPIHQLGYFQAWTTNRDGVHGGFSARGAWVWTASTAADWGGACQWHGMYGDNGKGVDGNKFPISGSVHTYTITRDEGMKDVTNKAGEVQNIYNAEYTLRRDTVKFDSINLNAVFQAEKGGAAYTNMPDFTKDDTGYFYLSERISTDFYAVRIYNRALSVEELQGNHLVDIIIYYGLEIDEKIYDEDLFAAAAYALSAAEIVTDASAKAANRALYQARLDAALGEGKIEEICDYTQYYAQNGLVALYTAFAGDTTANVIEGVWANRVEGGKDATFKGSIYWTKKTEGVGYSLTLTNWTAAKYTVGLDLPAEYEDFANFTVETFAKVEGITNADGTRYVNVYKPASTDEEGNEIPASGKQYGVYAGGLSAFRFGILNSLFFSSLDKNATQSLAQRWYLNNQGYPDGTPTVPYENISGGTTDQSWRLMGPEDTPTAGLMQITKKTTANDVTYQIGYNASETLVADATISLDRYNEIAGTKKANDYSSYFSLFNGIPATVYAVRVYDRVLTQAEKEQNAFVDKAAYFRIDLTGFEELDGETQMNIIGRFATIGANADRDIVQAIYNFMSGADNESLASKVVAFDGYAPILSGASGYRVLFNVNTDSRDLFESMGYTVTYGAIVAPGGNYNAVEDVTIDNEDAIVVTVNGPYGTNVYYNLAGAGKYQYSVAVTSTDSALYGADMIVRGYVALTDADGNTQYVYVDVYENEILDGEVSILAAADYFVNDFDGDIATQYKYMNSAALRAILAECGLTGRVALEDDLAIFVDAENGSDENNGLSADNAYATLEAAMAAAKAHLGKPGIKNVVINLAAGEYSVTETLKLSAEDILADEYSFRVTGQGDDTVVNALTTIDNSSVEYDDNTGAAYVQLEADANGDYPALRAVFGDGELLTMAHLGDKDNLLGTIDSIHFVGADGNILQDTEGKQFYHVYDDGSKNDWALTSEGAKMVEYAVFNLPLEALEHLDESAYEGAELHFTQAWTYNVSVIDHVVFDYDAGLARAYVVFSEMSQSMYRGYNVKGYYFWLENSLGFIGENPDTYYYDQESGKLYFYEENYYLEDMTIAYSPIDQLFAFDGVNNITFENLTLTGLDNKMAAVKTGYGFGQAGAASIYTKGQARQSVGFTNAALVYANNVNGLTVQNVTVKNALSAGIVTKGISENVTIDSSIFENLGDAAIRIGNGAYSGTTYTKGLTITNNYVTNIGIFDKAAVAVQSFAVANAKIVGNTVVNVPYSGFSFGWIWSTIGNTAEDIISGAAFSTFNMEIAYNYITDCMTCTGDGGPIYLLGGNVRRSENDATAYNFMHHNYVNMSEETGLHGNNAKSRRFAMGYYHDNSSSNWIDYENVLINTSTGTFNAWYMQHIEKCEAQNIKLINNYHIGVSKTANGYNLAEVYTNGKVVNADFGIVANDYVYANANALKNNTSIGVQTYANATTKESPANASTIVAGIFAAAGSDLAPEAKVSGLSWTAPAVDRVVLMDADIADVSGFEGVEVHSVTFTDGERTTVTQGVAGVKVAVPAIFAEDGYTYEFSVDGVVVDPAEIVIGDADITVDVKITVKTYTLLIKDGMQTVELVLPYGEKVVFPEEFFKTGYATTFTTTDGEVLDADNFTMPATNLEVRATYALEKHMVTFTDANGVKHEFYSTYGANVPMPTTKFTAPFGHTTKYFVDGVEVKSLTVPTSDLAVEVRYVPNTYDVKFVNKIGVTETPYATIQVVFGQAITLPAAPEAFEAEGYRYIFTGWLGYTEGMILETEGITFYTEWTAEEIKPDVPELAAGDINGDGVVDIADIVAVINKASGAELDAEAYPGDTDINADGVVDIADIVAVINIASGSAS